MGKTETHSLYSCNRLSDAKIHLKIDKTPGGCNKKFLKYCSKPNPLLQINSPTKTTTVFLSSSSSKSVLKSTNELNENRSSSFKCNDYSKGSYGSKIVLFSNPKDYKKHQMFPSKNKFNAKSSNRYLPNILKKEKTNIGFCDVKSGNENQSSKDTCHRKRKQIYHLSSDTDLDLQDSKEENSFPPPEKKQKFKLNVEIQNDSKEDKISEEEVIKKAEAKVKNKVEDNGKIETKIDEATEPKITKKTELKKEIIAKIEVKLEKQKETKVQQRNDSAKQIETKIQDVNGNHKRKRILEENKPLKKRAKIERKCKSEYQSKVNDMKKNNESSCARVCSFVSKHSNFQKSSETSENKFRLTNLSEKENFINPSSEDEQSSSDDETPSEDDFQNDIKNDFSIKRETTTRGNVFNYETIDIKQENLQEASENSEQEQESERTDKYEEKISEDFPNFDEGQETSVEALLGFENFKEFESEIQSFEEDYYKKKIIPFPVGEEFLIPDYLNCVHPFDLIEFLDDAHKLISSTLCSDFMKIAPINIVKHSCDLNGNELKTPNSNCFDFEEKFYFDLPAETSHLKFKNALINGYSSAEFDCDSVDQCYSNCSNIDYFEEKWMDHFEENKKDIIVGIDDKLLNSGSFESYEEENDYALEDNFEYYEEENVKNIMALNVKTEDIFPDTPKSFQSNGEAENKFEIYIDSFKCHKCDITFGKQRSLTTHINKAHSVYSYACNRCLAPFNTRIQLQRHTKYCFRDSRKTLTCNICDKKYSYQTSLMQHMKKQHFQ